MTTVLIPGGQDRPAQARAEVRAQQPADQRGAEGGQEAEGGERAQAQQARRGAARLREGQARRQGARVMFRCQVYLAEEENIICYCWIWTTVSV